MTNDVVSKINLDLEKKGWSVTSTGRTKFEDIERQVKESHPDAGYIWAGDDLWVDFARWPRDKEKWKKFVEDWQSGEADEPEQFVY